MEKKLDKKTYILIKNKENGDIVYKGEVIGDLNIGDELELLEFDNLESLEEFLNNLLDEDTI